MKEIKRDLVTLLKRDHLTIKELLVRAHDRANFEHLERFLVAHEVAEEQIVYPAVRSLPGGEAITKTRLAEQQQDEIMLRKLEQASAVEYRSRLNQFQTEVIDHAELEEVTAFSLLSEELTKEELVRLGDRYERAKAAAPSHPHPHAPNTPPGNIFFGPVASLADRIRDAVRRK